MSKRRRSAVRAAALDDGTRLDTSLIYTTAAISVTAAPEPAQGALLLAGLAGLVWYARRQRTGRAGA